MNECKRIKGRKSTNLTSTYKYGCDLCTESGFLKDAKIIPAYTGDIHGKLYCPYAKCPYAEEIETHSKFYYDEYDRYIQLELCKKFFSLSI
jgi:hypothetical protein